MAPREMKCREVFHGDEKSRCTAKMNGSPETALMTNRRGTVGKKTSVGRGHRSHENDQYTCDPGNHVIAFILYFFDDAGKK